MIAALLPIIGSVIDKIIPDKEAAQQAKLQLLKEENQSYITDLTARSNIIRAEANAGGLAASWRPITMLAFVALIAAHWFGFTPENLPPEQVEALLEIVKIGLGGYVVGRSAEKVAKEWKK